VSSRLDENDAVFILDKVLVPWQNVFVYGDLEKANNFFPAHRLPAALRRARCTRLAVKLDFMPGYCSRRWRWPHKDSGCPGNVGEVIAGETVLACPTPWCAIRSRGWRLSPANMARNAYAIIARWLHKISTSSSRQWRPADLLNSHARDSRTRRSGLLDQYLRGSGGASESASSFSSFCGIAWAASSAAHELYEINYGRSTEEIAAMPVGAMASATRQVQGLRRRVHAE